MKRFSVRLGSEQEDVMLSVNSTVRQVLEEAKRQGLNLPEDLKDITQIHGYINFQTFSLDDPAPIDEVLVVMI